MQGENIRAVINVDLNLGNALSGIDKLKGKLRSLEIPENAITDFESGLKDLSAEINKAKTLAGQIKPGDKTGMKKLESSYQNISRLAQQINSSFDGLGKEIIPTEYLTNLNKANQELQRQKQIQQDIANKKNQIQEQENKKLKEQQKFNDKITKNQALAEKRNKEANKILDNSKTVKNYVAALEKQAKAEKNLKEIKRTGTKEEIDEAKKGLEQAKEELAKAEKRKNQYDKNDRYSEYKRLKDEENNALKSVKTTQKGLEKEQLSGGKIDKISQEISRLKSELQSLESSSSLDKLKTDIKNIGNTTLDDTISDLTKLESVIKSLETSKIEELKKDINGLGNTTGLDRLNQDLRQSQQQLNQYRGEFDKLTMKQRDADDMKYRLTNFFSWSEGLNLIKRGAREAFQAVKDLDDAMTGTAVVTDFSVSDLWDMLPKYTETANKLGATVQGAYETMTLYYQQGLDTEAAFGMGTETMKMSRIADMDYVEGTDLMTAAIRGFHMDLTETSAKWVNDVYSELAAISASDTHEIATAMTKTASIADSANAEFDTTAAFLTQMIETTREAPETAGTALKTIIARFQELKKSPDEISDVDGEAVDANKIEAALRTIDVDLRDTTGQFRDFDDVILEISDKWDSLDTNTQRYIATVAAGARQQSRFIALVADNERLTELVAGAQNSAGASDKQFEKTMESLTAKLNTLKNAYHEFLMGILDSNIIKSGVDALTGLFNVLNNLADMTGPLSGLVKVLAAIGMFMGGRALVMNGISAISGGLTNVIAAGTAAGGGAGAAGVAAAMAASKEQRKEGKKQKKVSRKATMKAGQQALAGFIGGGLMANLGGAYEKTGAFKGALTSKGQFSNTSDIIRKSAMDMKNKSFAATAAFKPEMAALYMAQANSLFDEADRKDQKLQNSKKYGKGKFGKQKTGIANFFTGKANNFAAAGFTGTASAVTKLGGTLATLGPIGMAAGAGLAAVSGALLIYKNHQQKIIDKSDRLTEKFQTAKQTYNENKVALESLRDEYNSLSKGVDKNGKNIGLSAEQYERYKEITQEIADIAPDAVKTVDIEGNIILEDNAIDKALESQEFELNLTRAAYTSESNLKGIMASSAKSYQEATKGFDTTLKDYEKFVQGSDLMDNSSIGVASIRGNQSANKAQIKDLENLYDQRYDLLKESQEKIKHLAEDPRYGVDSLGYERAVEEYKQLQGFIGQSKELRDLEISEKQPIIDALKEYANTSLEIEGVSEKSVNDQVATANKSIFSRAIEDVGLTEGLTASEMHNRIDAYGEILSYDSEVGSEISGYFNDIEKAKNNFDDSFRDSEAIEEYNEAVEGSAEGLEELIKELEASGDADKIALAETLKAELNDIESYAQETKMTIAEAFNDLADEISEAMNIKEQYDSLISSGDYYTGRQNFKAIYDDMTSSVNIAGDGSQSFWAGAELMLDQQWLRENAGNVDAVKAKVKSLNSMMQDGASGAQAFTNQLYKMADNISEEELADLGLFFNEAGELDFENFKDENITALAEKLGLSAEFTTAMLNNLRQFTDINFSNIDDVVRTMKDTGVGVETSKGKMAVSRSTLQQQSGMTLPEFEEWAGQESTQDHIILVDYQLKDKNSLINFAKQMEEIAPSVFAGEIGKDTTSLKGETLNLDDYIAASNMLGATQEEATGYLEELSRQGVEINGIENGESIADAVADGYGAINSEDPLVGASDSMNNAATAMMALVAILGGGMDVAGDEKDYQDQKTKDNGAYDIGTKKGKAEDYQQNFDFDKAQKDLDYARAKQEAAQLAADKAETKEAREAAQKRADTWERRGNAIQNSMDIHSAEVGETVTIGGQKYVVSEDGPRGGKTLTPKGEENTATTQSSSSQGETRREQNGTGALNHGVQQNPQNTENPIKSFSDFGTAIGQFLAKAFSPELMDQWETNRDERVANRKQTTEEDRAKVREREETKKEVSKQGQEKFNLGIEVEGQDQLANIDNIISGLTEEQQEVVINALTDAADGNLSNFMSALSTLPPEVQAQIIAELTGEDPAAIQAQLETIASDDVVADVTVSAKPALEDMTLATGLMATFAGGASASFKASGLASIISQLRSAINLKNQLNSGSDAKGSNIPTPGRIQGFASMAKGGKIGPNGNGGMTLTGELGPEIVWLPDKSESFITGVGGPQMVSLPSNAVVYPHNETKKILDSNRGLPQFGSMGSGSVGRVIGGGSGTPTSSTGSGNRSSAGTEEEKWENDIDWLYNLLEDINEVLRDREKLEKRYEQMLERRNASLSDLIELQKEQLANLETQKALEQERYDKRLQEMNEYLQKNADLASKYGITYNKEDMTIEIDWEKIDAITDEKEGEKVNDMISRLEEIQDEMDEAEDSLMEIEELVAEIEARGKEEFLDLEGRIIDALEQIAQNEIDKLEEVNSSINDANSRLMDSIRDAVDKSRQERENQKTEEEIGKTQRRLAYLKQDTSGMNDLEIKQLEEQLKEQQEQYGDTLVDQKLQEMQDQNDKAAEQRERQIAILEEQLEYNKESGIFAQQAREILVAARDDLNDGKDLLLTTLYQIISQGENWQNKSEEDLIDSKGELNQQLKESSVYLDNRNNENYMKDMQEWMEVILDPKSTNEDKAEAVFEISQLETQRNLKLNEEEKAKIYGTSTDTAYTDLARDLAEGTSVDYMANMQDALASGDLETLRINEDLRNKKLQLIGKSNEQTDFYEQALKAESDVVSLAAPGEDGYVDYMQNLKDALAIGDFDQAYYWELMRDRKLDLLGKYNEKTGGSITSEAMKNWAPTQQQAAQQQQQTSQPKKVSELWTGTFQITRQTTGDFVESIVYALKQMGLYDGQVSKSFTDESYKALRKFAGISQNLNPFSFGPKTMDKFKVKGYLRGGLADYTGPAWLDGTPSKPELVLNARDTENFIQLKDILADLRGFKGKTSQADKTGDTYYDVQINVDKISNDYDVEKMAEKIKKIIHKDSRYRNVNAINFLR